jgi:hypothetical protein
LTNWTNAGFTIPNYTVNCSTQPSLATGSGNASANATAIQNSLASCDATHNVVVLPSGTYYVNGFNFGTQGKQVLRGAGANLTYLYMMTNNGCAGLGGAICMMDGTHAYGGSASVLPPGGTSQCLWTGGYSQGTTLITLNTCPGGPPSVGTTIILDQGNDSSDTGGVTMCDETSNNNSTFNCTYENGVNQSARLISGVYHGEQQVTYVTAVSGSGPYTVTISPGVYFTNIRSGQSPGAWWPGFVQNDGIENLTVDYSQNGGGATDISGITMYDCYQCWQKGVRSILAQRAATEVYQSDQDVIRDNYYYGAASHAQTSYNVEFTESSGFVFVNNITQQTTTTLNMSYASAGAVIAYNFAVDNQFGSMPYTYTWGMATSHSTGNNFNLYEGNIDTWMDSDNGAGPGTQQTAFRNLFTGLYPGRTSASQSIILAALERDYNFVGNVLGTSGYHTQYQAYATSTSAFTGSAPATSVYLLGAGGTGPSCTIDAGQSTQCDPLVFNTMMRWGNYDTLNATTRYDLSEGCPPANTYVNANCTNFGTPSMTIPPSLVYSTTPSWWPSGKTFPIIGPDVTSGNIGVCSGGTYAGSLATSAGQCTGGTLSAGWASHAISNPAMDCFLGTMGGPPNGSGSVLSFNAAACYSSSPPVTAPGTPVLLIVSP